MVDMIRIPRDLLARLMAAIETPADLSEDDKTALLEEVDRFYPHEEEAA